MATLKYKNPATSAWETLDALPAIGQTVEITATELAGKSTADRAAMYAAGTRLLKVVNGDTEVLLGLDADGSTEWLGSNKPVRNLLDNSDFTNPVNQRGATGAINTQGSYPIDRWFFDKSHAGVSAGIDANNRYFYMANNAAVDGAWCSITHKVPAAKIAHTGKYTFVLHEKIIAPADVLIMIDENSSPFFMQRTTFTPQNGYIAFSFEITALPTANISFYIYASKGITVSFDWAALYEGSYTTDTLPPYTPKGYAAELAECQRYYQACATLQLPIKNPDVDTNNIFQNSVQFFETMRIAPTINAVVGNSEYGTITIVGTTKQGFHWRVTADAAESKYVFLSNWTASADL